VHPLVPIGVVGVPVSVDETRNASAKRKPVSASQFLAMIDARNISITSPISFLEESDILVE
jgi:hypothetical protein